jgi:2,5-diketo-D-gluconate reductase B
MKICDEPHHQQGTQTSVGRLNYRKRPTLKNRQLFLRGTTMNLMFQKNFQRAFGTYPLKGEALLAAVASAIETGYRAFDTAQMYGNEAETGEALQNSNLARPDLCIVTKVHPDNYSEAKFLPSVEESLKKLRADYVDVLLLHWPTIGGDIAPSLRLLQKALDKGYARHIGISNYTVKMMHQAKAIVDAPLLMNQIEFHPLLNQNKLLAAATETGIPLSSYCSVARGEIFKYPLFEDMGKSYGKSSAQIALRWILQKGVVINTMSTKPENIAANYNIMDFTLSNIDIARIDALNDTNYRIVKAGLVPWAPDWD